MSQRAVAQLTVGVQNHESRAVISINSDKLINASSFFLPDPSRLVLDIKKDDSADLTDIPLIGNGIIKALRHGVRDPNLLRVVFELSVAHGKLNLEKINTKKSKELIFILKKQSLDLSKNSRLKSQPKSIVVVDAGHGGIDSGAVGPTGVLEKDITLAVSYFLADYINSHPDMRAILSRPDDSKIRLRQRVKVARESNADLFLSIHADAINNQLARGSSVYVLSQRGASSELARMLAKKSNESDYIGAIKREKKDEDLWETLVDLSQRVTIEESIRVADKIIKQLNNFGPVHQPMVQYAGFMVLKALDIPSVLIETAFISNPVEEKRLSNPHAQRQIASWIYRGVCDYLGLQYFSENYQRQYKVSYGDTLSTIALRLNVSLKALKQINGLKSDKIKQGQLLKIPIIK